MTDALRFLDASAETLILAYFLLINTFYFLFNVLSLAGILRYRRMVTFVRFGEIFLIVGFGNGPPFNSGA